MITQPDQPRERLLRTRNQHSHSTRIHTHQPAKSSELRFCSPKARRPAGSAVWCCEAQIGRSVICMPVRSIGSDGRACGRVLLSPSPAVGQASRHSGKESFSLASPPLPQSQFRVRARARDMRHPSPSGRGSTPVASASRSVLCSWADARCAGMWWS